MIYAIGKFLCHFANVLWFNFTIEGKENIPKDGRLVICANHVSLYDPVVIATQVRRPIHYMAKAELYKNKVLAWLLRAVKTFPVDRSKVSMETLKTALQILKQDEILGIFPEGTRVKGEERQKPLDGFEVFALKTKSPILPVHIQGTFKFRGKVTVRFGKPIYLDEYFGKKLKGEEMAKLSGSIMDQIYTI